jgi:hypothetical protein
MTVTIDFARLENGQDACLAGGHTDENYLAKPGRDILVVPGSTIALTLRVTAGEPTDIIGIATNGTIETRTVHGLGVGDPIHLSFESGLSKTTVSPYLKVKAVTDDHHFTIEDDKGVQVILKKEVILGQPAEAQPPISGWVAKAANLEGYHGAIVIDLASGRQDQLLGTAAIQKGSTQIQIKGSHELKKGDTIALGGTYQGCVKMAMQVNAEGGCFTIAEMTCKSDADIKFTEGKIASLVPYEPKIEAFGPGNNYGWVNVTLSGTMTRHMAELKKPTDNNCPQFVGRFRYELRGIMISYPMWFKDVCQNEPTFVRIFDYGNVWV